jgi:hypothetical protein
MTKGTETTIIMTSETELPRNLGRAGLTAKPAGLTALPWAETV